MISLRDLKKQCEVEETEHAHDVYLVDLGDRALAHVNRKTRRNFGPIAQVTETLQGTGGSRLWLTEAAIEPDATTEALPISVIERAGPGDEETTITAAGDDGYVLRNNGLALVRKGGCWSSLCEYEVTYWRGAVSLPADVEQAVLFLVAHWFELRIPVALGTVAPSVDNTLNEILATRVRRLV